MENNILISLPGEGEVVGAFGSTLQFKVPTDKTGNRIGFYDSMIPAHGGGPKLHYHKETDETFIVTEGVLTLITLDGEVHLPVGGVACAPRLTPHGFRNDDDVPVKFIIAFNGNPEFQNREVFFHKMYKKLNEDPNDLAFFQDLYAEFDSYPCVDNMIPVKKD
ncbi:MAG TPA: cupin domain-containing protein [Mucilaginibacter sp.]|nr:cupin domain-containing protein [Mucilaginibacter sp.]